jgi:predicted XRE-type DNA-binding protein
MLTTITIHAYTISMKLTNASRKEIMDIITESVRLKLVKHKQSGIRFKSIAEALGVPRERISEAATGKYLGKKTLNLLVSHGLVTPEEVVAGLNQGQRGYVLGIIKV